MLFINPNAWAASINFGPTPLGSSPLQVVNISNPLTSPLSLGTIGLVSDEFKIQSDGCSNQILAVPASCEVNVRFTPQTVGAKTAQLTVPGVNSTTPLLTIPCLY